MSLLELCSRLGQELGQLYRKANYDVASFSQIASDVFMEHQHMLAFTPDDIIEAATSPALPSQGDVESTFGEPAVTLFFHPRFRIDALCWRKSTTSIHQHQFSGAFAVLWGSSLQSTFEFRPSKRVSDTFQVGALKHRASVVLPRGHIEPIHLGDRLIHSVFHLDVPSITLVARTHANSQSGPQFRYERPNVAYDPFAKDYQSAKRLQIAEYLMELRPTGYVAPLLRIISEGTIPLAFALLRRGRAIQLDRDVWSVLMEGAIAAHGPVMGEIAGVFEEYDRQRMLTTIRRSLKDEDLRFFLAVLLNVPGARRILTAVEDRGGTEASAQIVAWIEAIKRLPNSREPLSEVDRIVLTSVLSKAGGDTARHEEREVSQRESWRASYERLRTSRLTSALFVDDAGINSREHVSQLLARR